MTTTTDRGEIIHFAGFHHLSPVCDQRSGPAFSAEAGDKLTRCGWEAFFEGMRRHGLALTYDPGDAASARFVPARQARPSPGTHGGLGHALEHARRFWKALFPSGAASHRP
jgi:hypothetical protein